MTEQKQIRDFICSLRFESMKAAKMILRMLLSTENDPSVNDLCKLVHRVPFEFGDHYIWIDLFDDLLSNKYGAAYRKHPKTNKAYFVIQLPVPEYVE